MENKEQARIGIRLPEEYRKEVDQLIQAGYFKNISDLVRKALKEFLREKGSWEKPL